MGIANSMLLPRIGISGEVGYTQRLSQKIFNLPSQFMDDICITLPVSKWDEEL